MKDLTHRSDIKAALAKIKQDSGSHSPSIATIQRELPQVTVNIDACFLSNPYATDLFLDYFDHELVGTGRLRRAIEYYPSQNAAVARRVAQRLAVAPECVFVGNGAVEIIQAILHNFCQHTLLLNLPTFSPYYEFVRPGTRVIFHKLRKEHAFTLDVDEYLALVRREQPDTVVLINPNNPDGGYVSMNDMRALLHALRGVATVILDESFVDFAFEDQLLTPVSFAGLSQEFGNVLLVKSMSKDFGIAGLRAGYAIMDAAKVRQLLGNGFLWNSSGLAEYFFELWSRTEFAQQYDQIRTRYIREAQAFFHALRQIEGITVYPTKANFALVELLHGTSAFDFVSHLLIEHGIYIRGCGDKKGLDGEFVRIAARTAIENQHILHGIKEITGRAPFAAAGRATADTTNGQPQEPEEGASAAPQLLGRAEVLGGLTGRITKQASTVVALIENRTAQLAVQAQQTTAQRVARAHGRAADHAFFGALLLSRERSSPVLIDDLERFAPQWAGLVPDSSQVRAAIARQLGHKYQFSHPHVPRLRAALGLDTPAVQQAFQRLHTEPISSIFTQAAVPAALPPSHLSALRETGAAQTLGLHVVPVNQLLPHEYHNPQRVARLAQRISADGVLANPPLVVALPDGERYMVLDGATRTMAFTQLGYHHLVVQVVDPHKDSVQLDTWGHVVHGPNAAELLALVHSTDGIRTTRLPVEQLAHALWEHQAMGYLVTAEREGFLLEHAENAANIDWLDALAALVERYGASGTVERTLCQDVSVLASQYADLAALVVFAPVQLDAVLQLVAKGRLLPAGLTRFVVGGRILRLNVPLALLASDELVVHKQGWLDKLVGAKLAQGGLRQYQEPVILLDE